MKNKIIYFALAITVAFTISFQIFYNSVSAQKKTNWEYLSLIHI